MPLLCSVCTPLDPATALFPALQTLEIISVELQSSVNGRDTVDEKLAQCETLSSALADKQSGVGERLTAADVEAFEKAVNACGARVREFTAASAAAEDAQVTDPSTTHPHTPLHTNTRLPPHTACCLEQGA